MFTCREEECRRLELLLTGGFRGKFPAAVFVHGPPLCGKKLTTKYVLDRLQDTFHAHVSCHLGSSGSSAVLEEILSQLFPESEEEGCANFSELVSKLKQRGVGNKRVVIALSDAEHLRSLDFNLLPAFLRLQTYCGQKITVVFISRIPWKKWELEGMTLAAPVTVNFLPYSKPQLVKLLSNELQGRYGSKKELQSLNEEERTSFFADFSDMLQGTFHAVCRTLPQFDSVAEMTFETYLRPVSEGKIAHWDSLSLYRNVEPFLKECLLTANLKEFCGAEKQPERLSVELPFFSKFLLIAAFVASHNPVSCDKRFFMKGSDKRKKSRNTAATLAKVAAHKRSSQLLGPRMFPMDRMLAIFYVIIDMQGLQSSSEILSQVSSLVKLDLLTQVGNHASLDSGLDSPKFRCNVGLDFIRLVAKNVRFDIHNYLYDLIQ